MGSYAFISDVHANLEALDAVLGRLHGEKVYCLGDIVGYGASPNEVVQRLKAVGAVSIRGNHDNAVVTGDVSDFNARAGMTVQWTRRSLDGDSLAYLTGLPTSLRADLDGVEVYMTHGSPDDNLWEYVDPATHGDLLGYYLKKLAVKAIALGHTHLPYVWTGKEGTVFNPGSVGQPRNGDRRASYAIADVRDDGLHVELMKIDYDYVAAAQRIKLAGLPVQNAARLLQGV